MFSMIVIEAESWQNLKDEKNLHHHIYWISWELQRTKNTEAEKIFWMKILKKLNMTCRNDWTFFLQNFLRRTRLLSFGCSSRSPFKVFCRYISSYKSCKMSSILQTLQVLWEKLLIFGRYLPQLTELAWLERLCRILCRIAEFLHCKILYSGSTRAYISFYM